MGETLTKSTQPDSYIEDIDKAEYVAYKEKPHRDHIVDLKRADETLEGMHSTEEAYPGFHETQAGAVDAFRDEIGAADRRH